jgi:hypothetical protein
VLDPEQPIIDPHHHLREGPSGRYHLPELAKDLAGGHNVLATVFVDSQSGYRSEGPELMRRSAKPSLSGGGWRRRRLLAIASHAPASSAHWI